MSNAKFKTMLLTIILILFSFLLNAQDFTGTFGSIDKRYDRNKLPDAAETRSWFGTAWRGERLNAQIVLWSTTGADQMQFAATSLRSEDRKEIPSSCIKPYFVKYVLTDDGSHKCGETDFSKPALLAGDVLDTAQRIDVPANTVQPLWISIDIPQDVEPGLYLGKVIVVDKTGKSLDFEIKIDVLSLTLPKPSEWFFHLDLWQNPWSVARFHGVEPWSQEHIKLLKPLLKMLAEAGQKVITTSIIHRPWGKQTYDAYESMVKWVRKKVETWKFDFSDFDRYVELCDEMGITSQINCYSMVTWSDDYRYFDEAKSEHITVHAVPGTDAYNGLWKPFLVDFVKHLEQKGWLGRTTIAMDERSLDQMKGVIALVQNVVPDLKISLAGKYHKSIASQIHDFSYNWTSVDADTPEICNERRANGFVTTYYSACGMAYPNSFTFSPPAEQAWIGWFAASRGFDGFLRWAYNSWVKDPLIDTRHIKFPAGDCFQVYPGPRSSIRFERLREGIQDYEKIRILKKLLRKNRLKKLIAVMQNLEFLQDDIDLTVSEAKRILEELSRAAIS